MRAFRSIAGPIVAAFFATVALAQQAPSTTAKASEATPTYGAMNFQTSVGSFKLLGPGEVPPQGKLTISFTGTVLISGLYPGSKVTTTGNVRREIHDEKRGKTVYHGKGTLTLDGKSRAVQFFGRELNGRFVGMGIFRLYGEFDKKLNTGFYQYDGSPERRPWATGGLTVVVPSEQQSTPKPRVRINPNGG